MDDPKENKVNLRWVVIVVLLTIGIDGLLTRLLENLWVSLRDRNSPTYLPLEWWMSAPFTLFVFVVLSALLTSFSGAKSWFKTFLLLCGCKILFSGVTAFFFSFRPYPDLAEAAMQSALLSLPSVLVHILLSGMIVLFLKEVFVGQLTKEEPAYPFLPGEAAEEMPAEQAVAVSALEEEEAAKPALSEEREEALPAQAEEKSVLLPVSEILKVFPSDQLAMSPSQIAEISPSIPIPLDDIIPQLPEGRVEVEALTVISGIAPEAFARPPEEVAKEFPNGMMELPLREVVSRVPPQAFQLPEQELQPDVDAEFADFFREEGAGAIPPLAGEEPVPVSAAEQTTEELQPRPGGIAIEEPLPVLEPAEEIAEPAVELSEDVLVISEKEQLLFESARDVVTVSTEAIISQFPLGAVNYDPAERGTRAENLPETIVVPLELIALQLATGEVKLHAKYVFPQFPEGCLSISELDVVRSLPNGEVELPLPEIVPQLPPEFLAPPEQIQQPTLEEMPDPFHEEQKRPPVEVMAPKATPTPEGVAIEEEAPPLELEPSPLEGETVPQAAPPAGRVEKKKPPSPSYPDMLREENPLDLSLRTVVRLLPEGAFAAPLEDLRRHVSGETVRVPRSMVMGQLKEGRVVVPVEILTIQFLPEHFAMSIEQIKARFAEGLVELPLPELVGQVLEEIAQPLEAQRQQPVCDQISTPFQEMPSEVSTAPPGGVSKTAARERPLKEASARRPTTVDRTAPSGRRAERSPIVGVTAQQKAASVETGRTILSTLLQKCKGLGVSGHRWLAAGDSSAVVLAPANLSPEVAALGAMELMAQLRGFCADCQLGEPFKLVLYSTDGAVVGGQLVRGDPKQLIILASLNKSGAGIMSLLLDRFETQLRDLPTLTGPGMEVTEVARPVNLQLKKMPLKRDGLPKEICVKILSALSEVGGEDCLPLSTPSGQKVVAVGGKNFDAEMLLSNGVFDLDSLLRYSSDVGVGEFEGLILVTEQANVTLNRSLADPSAYLLCFFSRSLGEGLVRAKAARAANLLTP